MTAGGNETGLMVLDPMGEAKPSAPKLAPRIGDFNLSMFIAARKKTAKAE